MASLMTPYTDSVTLKYKKTALTDGFLLAGAVRFELTTLGFGDRCSTN